MKVCSKCGEEIGTKDGENKCKDCEEGKRKKTKITRKTRDSIMRDLGMTRVKGALGGTYYE